LSTGLFSPDFQERDLWTIQDRDSGILIRDSGGAMSAGISCIFQRAKPVHLIVGPND